MNAPDARLAQAGAVVSTANRVHPGCMRTGSAPQVPGDRHPDSELTQAVSAVAARLGIAPATLRTWDRRYGLGPSQHTTGRHRRYAPDDVARLILMTRGLRHGAAPAEAARYALQADAAALAALAAEAGLDKPPAPPMDVPGLPEFLPAAASGAVVALALAAQALDARAMQRQLSSSIVDTGVAEAWESVIRPVLSATGARWAATGVGAEVEHALSECVTSVLSRVMLESTGESSGPAVLLACAPGEFHCLPLRVLGALLAQHAVPVILLGGDIPLPALSAAVHTGKPAVVFLWAQMDRSADPHLLDQLPDARYVLGGPAWNEAPPAEVRVVRRLTDAHDALLALAQHKGKIDAFATAPAE